jgi:hypothetical protein
MRCIVLRFDSIKSNVHYSSPTKHHQYSTIDAIELCLTQELQDLLQDGLGLVVLHPVPAVKPNAAAANGCIQLTKEGVVMIHHILLDSILPAIFIATAQE